MIKRLLRQRIGWLPLYEMRNKLLLSHTAVPLRRFEDAEVTRLSRALPGGKPRATVATVVLTYRRPDDLRRAVASVLGQTFRDQVVIVVDDGGGLPDLPADPRLSAVSLSRNIGVAGVSRNVGIRLTDSEFVAFLDDDNLWHPGHLETALGRLRGPDAPDAVYTAMRRVTPDGALRDVLSVPFDRQAARNSSFLDPNPLVARRARALHFSRIRRAKPVAPREDWEMIFRYSRHRRVEHVPVPTVDYLVNPDSYWTAWNTAR
ncbi:glycosyltransferase family 2 protein [Actinoplanes sp. HUAS TT8]|uniref:glycosyltransferase family 2 protein n=1 Tax=Actinoplanes sp. HUAS TT8 TaxID=3447453 RepID=UPI003F522E64